MQKIKRACKVITEHSQIHVIKRLPVDRKNGLFYETNYRNKLLRTSVKYIGIDMLNNTIPLEDQWLKINFEKHTEFWDKILKLKENETVEVPTGSSGNSVQEIDIPEIDKGPTILYHQSRRDQCLVFSLASVFDHLNMDHICKQLIRFNNQCLVSQKLCDLNDVIDVMNNKHRLKGEKRIRVQIRKVKLLKSLEVLNDRYNDKIYHCILENHHAVVFYKQYIFDPIFKNALPRSIKYLKLCAEMGHEESVEKVIFKAICYEYVTTKK